MSGNIWEEISVGQVDQPGIFRRAFQCMRCYEIFPDQAGVQNHIAVVHRIPLLQSCPVCNLLFHDQMSLSNHMQIHTTPIQTQVVSNYVAPQENFNCEFCGQIFDSVQYMNIHKSHCIKRNCQVIQEQPNMNAVFPYDMKQQPQIDQQIHLKSTDIQQQQPVMQMLQQQHIPQQQLQQQQQEQGTIKQPLQIQQQLHQQPAQQLPLKPQPTVKPQQSTILEAGTDGDAPPLLLPCELCEEQFNSELELTKHMQVHTGGILYQCEECDKTFEKKQAFTVHIKFCGMANQNNPKAPRKKKTDNSDNMPYQCSTCGFGFLTMDFFRAHQCNAHNNPNRVACTVCQKTFPDKFQLARHTMVHTGIQYRCIYCRKTYPTKDSLESHLELHSESRPYKCAYCTTRHLTVETLTNHTVSHLHKNDPEEDGSLNYCPTCSMAFELRKNLRNHIQAVHQGKKFTCQTCGQSFRKEHQARTHSKVHLRRRIRLQTPKSALTLDQLVCEICNKQFKREAHLKRHRFAVHKQFPNLVEGKMFCKFCYKIFLNKKCLDTHMNNKHGRFRCQICEKRFGSEATFQKHAVFHSVTQSPFPCTKCPLRYATKQGLQGHMRTAHRAVPWRCSVCSITFGTPKRMIEHIQKQSHHSEENTEMLNNRKRLSVNKATFLCNSCPKRYTTEELLQKHALYHDESRQFPCTKCTYRFNTKMNLHQHLSRRHDCVEGMDFTWKCGVCSRTYQTRAALGFHIHIKEHHSAENDQLLDDHPESTEGIRLYYCNVCGLGLRRPKGLLRHVFRSKHASEGNLKFMKSLGVDIGDLKPTTGADYTEEVRKAYNDKMYKEKRKRYLKKSKQWNIFTKHSIHERKHACKYCGKLFSDEPSLVPHMMDCSTMNARECPLCKVTVYGVITYSKHLVAHLKDGERCPVCNKSLIKLDRLRLYQHYSLHKDFTCEVCEQTFNVKHNYDIHCLKHNDDNSMFCEICKKRCVKTDHITFL